ncbi:putative mannosyl alpha-1; 6-glycoprotein beta-1; 6-N-acetyl-glucosaminyltransferase; isozyme B [Paratrimastix pyriformis]|uniref:alpha-1,6-mannosyl-glycoprotein 6-beta-N-acetylglucosaminyltransferase n=1 Tax=Paratrimastix pyriformis TaxID=342808 RepID=A0ABQ8UUD4_9EUKA|nr:putative mannosyl alpha-1; 6-glycoprotein beta-1; 6-N-acetyl-glucosaminyltransferase; isozyme B [Paratrimastix pyriformis]
MACVKDFIQDGTRKGGPGGELVVKDSFERALRALGHEYVETSSRGDLEAALARVGWNEPPAEARGGPEEVRVSILVTDPFMLTPEDRRALMPDRSRDSKARAKAPASFRRPSPGPSRSRPACGCRQAPLTSIRGVSKRRMFISEFFGTPPRVAQHPLTARDYLTPTPLHDQLPYRVGCLSGRRNTYLGFIVDPVTPRARRGNQGVVWGKESKYFTAPNMRLLAELALHHNYTLHTTISPQRGYSPALFSRYGLVEGVHYHNHGHLSRPQYQELLGQADFLVGLGHPIAGPTVLEAIAAGLVVLNPVHNPPFLYSRMAEVEYPSQHPYAAQMVGAPRVCTLDTGAMGPGGPDALRRAASCLAEGVTALRALPQLAPLQPAGGPLVQSYYTTYARTPALAGAARVREQATLGAGRTGASFKGSLGTPFTRLGMGAARNWVPTDYRAEVYIERVRQIIDEVAFGDL